MMTLSSYSQKLLVERSVIEKAILTAKQYEQCLEYNESLQDLYDMAGEQIIEQEKRIEADRIYQKKLLQALENRDEKDKISQKEIDYLKKKLNRKTTKSQLKDLGLVALLILLLAK